MDKDNRDDFTFARLSDLKLPVTFRMYVPHLPWPQVSNPGTQISAGGAPTAKVVYRASGQARVEVSRRTISVRSFPEHSPSCAITQNSRTLSDLYVTCQLIADNKPLTIPFRTSFKAFKTNYT